jgi:hypothetical protein
VYLWDKSLRSDNEDGSQTSNKPDRPERVVHGEVRVVIASLIGLMVLVGTVVGRRRDPLDQGVAYSLACCGMLLVSPLAWGHYYMAEAPAVLLVPIWIWRRGMARAATAAAVIPLVLTLAYYIAMGTVGTLGLLGLGMTAWFIAACVLMLWLEFRGWIERRRVAPGTTDRSGRIPHFECHRRAKSEGARPSQGVARAR